MSRSAARWMGALLVLAGIAQAQEEPDSALQRVIKSFGKLQSYKVEFSVDGGQAEGADHRVVSNQVKRAWSADVHGHLCRIDNGAAWRPRLGAGSGAIKDGMGAAKALLSTDEGRLIERLFVRPEDVLGRVKGFKDKARWGSRVGPPPAAEVLASLEEDESDAEAGPSKEDGKSQVRQGKTSKSKSGKKAPAGPTESTHRIVVEGPPQVALQQFTDLQNSGCFEAG